jgi:hypothetical protein
MIEKPIFRYGHLETGSLCKLYRSDDVYIPSADDHSNPADLMRFVDNVMGSPHMYVLGRDARHEAFIFSPAHNATTYMAHFAVRKDKRDGTVVRKVAEAGKWIFENTTCRAIMTFIRADNEGARSVLSQLGMKKIGKTDKTVLFGGVYRDELIYQCTMDDFNITWGELLGEV